MLGRDLACKRPSHFFQERPKRYLFCSGYNFALAEIREYRQCCVPHSDPGAELLLGVVLAHLLLAFELYPSEKEIVWKMSGIASPSVKGSKTTKPEMPILMTSL